MLKLTYKIIIIELFVCIFIINIKINDAYAANYAFKAAFCKFCSSEKFTVDQELMASYRLVTEL